MRIATTLGLLVIMVGFGYFAHDRILQREVTAAKAQVDKQWRAAENRALLNLQERFSILLTQQRGTHEYLAQQGHALDDHGVWYREHQRVRDERRAAVSQQIASADPESLRAHAEATRGNFDRCTGHVERFGREAAACSATAHAIDKDRDDIIESVTGIRPPRSPRFPNPPQLQGATQ